MKYFVTIIILSVYSNLLQAQEQSSNYDNYLEQNRTDLRHDKFYIDKNVVGFTVMHGSKKAEEAELALIKSQLEKVDTFIYIPEVDPAMGHYFNVYMNNGDENLLKDLILTYKKYVPQEASVEMFNKWKELRKISQNKHIAVYGLDYAQSYKYFVKRLLEISKNTDERLFQFWNDEQTDYNTNADTPLKQYLQTLVSEYQTREITNNPVLSNLIENIADTFTDKVLYRDSIMYRNYVTMKDNFGTSKQFIRMGLFHMTKSGFVNMKPGIIAQLIANGIYSPDEVNITIALLNKSKVLLETIYDEKGKYNNYTETGDDFYTGESFLPGVSLLAKKKLSDITFFDLSKNESPFKQIKGIIYPGFELLPSTTWADYFDNAILLDASEANKPIESIL